MFHFFIWEVVSVNNKKILKNDLFGIEIVYEWLKKEWEFYLFPNIDTNHNSIQYYCFDDIVKKSFFENVYKLPWIWPKTAYNISLIPYDDIKNALENLDIKFFQNIPWIWPKTAKRIVLELKNNIWKDDLSKIDIDEKLYKDIIKSLKNLWYDTNQVKKILTSCPIKLDKKNIADIIKWLIDNV